MPVATVDVAQKVAELIGRAPAGGIFTDVLCGDVISDEISADFRLDCFGEKTESFVIRVSRLHSISSER